MSTSKKKKIPKKELAAELKKMRISFLEGAIKKKAFSYQALGDFQRKLRKLKKN
ncbi:hypothetical protein J7L36_02135 [bacterium]|nr:hypothetical protein [bacterium]